MRIVSLLPSATETLFALGLGDQLVAVTHECDYPPEAAALPVVTRSTFDFAGKSSAEIEDAVALAARDGASLYEVDTAAIRDLRPDLVVAQDVCRVCAVPASQVMDELSPIPVLRQHPHTLDDVLRDIEGLASACGTDASAADVIAARTHRRGSGAGARSGSRARRLPRMARPAVSGRALDAGHPGPGRHRRSAGAGRHAVISHHLGGRGRGPAGGAGAGAVRLGRRARAAGSEGGLPIKSRVSAPDRYVVLDGSAYFNRPGPRLVDSLEVLVDGSTDR